MKKSSYFAIFSCCFFLFMSVYWATSNDQSQTFVQCLVNNSDNSTSMSEIIYTPTSPLYTKVLEMYIRNLRFETPETPKPLAILTPSQNSQIITAIYCSKETGLQMRIRSGGNDIQGSSYVSSVPFFVLDINLLRSISVDPQAKTVWVGAGATLGELYYAINKTDSSLAFAGGYWPTVGVSGHICSGGYGGLTRKHGLSADNVVDAVVIDAYGRILDRKYMGEGLFWALRGGSCASFVVVLKFKLRLVRVPKLIAGFSVTKTLEQDAISLIYKWQYYAPKAPRELGISIQLTNSLIANTTKQTVSVTFVASYLGDIDSLLTIMSQGFPELGIMRSDCAMIQWIDYNLYHFGFPLGNTAPIFLSRTPPGSIPYLKIKSDFVPRPLPKKGLKKITDVMKEVPSGQAQMEWTPFGGIMEEISESSIPFPHRKGIIYLMEERIAWDTPDPVISAERLAWARKLQRITGNYVKTNPRRAYVNYRDFDLGVNNANGQTSVEQARKWGGQYYQDNFDRLVRVKTLVDPENYFNYEQSIPLLPLNSSQ